jgi:hypothetical protein
MGVMRIRINLLGLTYTGCLATLAVLTVLHGRQPDSRPVSQLVSACALQQPTRDCVSVMDVRTATPGSYSPTPNPYERHAPTMEAAEQMLGSMRNEITDLAGRH